MLQDPPGTIILGKRSDVHYVPMSDGNGSENSSGNGWRPILRILSLPVGMLIIVLFTEPILNIATQVALELNVRWIVGFGIVAFAIFFVVDLLFP